VRALSEWAEQCGGIYEMRQINLPLDWLLYRALSERSEGAL